MFWWASVKLYFHQSFLREVFHRHVLSPETRILSFLGGSSAIFAAGGLVPGGTFLRLKSEGLVAVQPLSWT